MKSISKKKSSKNKIIILSAVTTLTLVAAGYFIYETKYNRDDKPLDINKVDYKEPTDKQIEAGNKAKKQTIDESKEASKSKDTPTVNPKTGNIDETQTGSSENKVLDTRITAASIENNTLYIRNAIDGIYAEGECTLTLTKGSQVITKHAGIQPLPKTSTCKGFNIPASELSPGIWAINLTVTVGNSSGSAKSKVRV